jgi:hypothetical protein
MEGEVKSMRAVGGLVCLGLLVAACGTTQGLTGGYKLYEAVSSNSSQQVSVIDSRSHNTERRLPLGVPSHDWKHLYSIVGSSLLDTDPQTGATLNTLLLPGTYLLPAATINGMPGGASPDGRWLVVESFERSATSVPTATHMLLIDTTSWKVKHRANLNGYFQFDAVSNDGLRLYLIQYLNGKEYYVRLYDVSGSRLEDNIVVDKSDGNQAMAGTRISGVTSPDGHWLFSMYVRENESPFVHALSLDGPFAFCLDLPGSGYANNPAEMRWSLAMDPAAHLYAVNGATGVVAKIDGSAQFNPQIERTAHLSGGKSAKAGSNAAVISRDGKTLVTAAATGIEWVDTGSLATRMQALGDWHIWSLALSPDGRLLYAVGDNGHIAEVSMATGEVAHTFDPAEGQPMALMRVALS